ncbi:MAG: NAD(P)-dependent oxidoreductase [Alphaproteobacteria bacterium]|nr:NAD(P)-dependent oxidoreductase [Alphaproteobacteria bacterium]
MATIAVLGMGLLGRGFAENLLRQGHQVRVWNRTASKCDPLVAAGAKKARSPADAVKGAERVHLVLTADAAVDSVIGAFRSALGEGVPVVDHSTNLPARVRERFDTLRSEGVRYIHAPVFMGPANSREGTGLMLICGPSDEISHLRPALQQMTGRVLELGEEPGRAAAIKLTGNGMLVLLTLGMGDLFQLGRANGLSPEDTLSLFDTFTPSPSGMGRRILGSANAPVGFELTMARKDVHLMIEAAGGEQALNVLPAIAHAMDRAIAEGHGEEDFTAFVRPG